MKKTILAIGLTAFGLMINAQSTFEHRINESAAKLNSITNVQELDLLFAEFSTLVQSDDKNKWMAYYYAGSTQYRKANLLLKSDQLSGAAEANALAYKYISGGVPAENAEAKELLTLIAEQKKKITRQALTK
jgi:hypothetical protein